MTKVLMFVMLITAVPASAGTIVSVSSPAASQAGFNFDSAVMASSFTTTTPFTGLTISFVAAQSPSTAFHGTAWLTTSLGPGETTLMSNTFTVPAGPTAPLSLAVFTGVSLDPGTYFLVIHGSDTGGLAGSWQTGSNPGTTAIVTAPGVTRNSDEFATSIDSGNPPASTFATFESLGAGSFTLLYSVTDASTAPEPATVFLIGAGCLLAIARLRKS